MKITVDFKAESGQSIGAVTASPKAFKTGSKGFYGQGKFEFEGKKYQVQVQMVEIGSKERAKAEG